MAKIFSKNGITATGKVLPYEEFVPFLDMESKDFDSEKMDEIVKEAEGFLDTPIPFLPLSLRRDFYFTGNRSNFQRPFFLRRNMLSVMTLAEFYEKKGRFIDKICDLVWGIMEETTWMIPAHMAHTPAMIYENVGIPETYGEDMLHGIDLFSAVTSALLTRVLRLLRKEIDAVSPFITERMEYELNKRTTKPFLIHVFSWSGSYGSKPNNWCPWIVSNVLYTVAFAERDIISRTAVVTRAMNYLDNFMNGYQEDGGCDEGPGYWSHAGGSLFDSLELIYDMTGGSIDIFSEPLIKAMGEYEAKFNINDDRFVNFADSSAKFYADGYLIERWGRRCDSEMLIAFGKMMTMHSGTGHTFNSAYRADKNLMTPKFTDAVKTKAAKLVYFDSLKVMIARESENTAEGMFLAIKGGNNRESHNHNDVGNFIVYSDGNPVIIDVGPGTYTKDTFGAKRYTNWNLQSGYHNVAELNGTDQRNGIEFKSENEVFDEENAALTLGLTPAYPSGAGVEEYTRTASLKGSTVTVADRVVLKKKGKINFHFMTHVEPEVISEGKLLLAEGKTLSYDKALTYSCDKITPEGMNLEKNWGSEALYRISLSVTAKEFNAEFVIE